MNYVLEVKFSDNREPEYPMGEIMSFETESAFIAFNEYWLKESKVSYADAVIEKFHTRQLYVSLEKDDIPYFKYTITV